MLRKTSKEEEKFMAEYINVTPENIETEHLCCAISDKKHAEGVIQKKEWLKKRLEEGHVFRKLNAQGKIFIEYAPLEKAWVPVLGDDFMYIYCLWVAGSFKEQGHGKNLLTYAIEDAKSKGKKGLCTITSKKKKPYLAEKKFFHQFGFEVVDTVGEYELLALTFSKQVPRFNETVKSGQIEKKGLVIYYSFQCPYTANCIREIESYKEEKQLPIEIIAVDTLEKAKSMPCVFNNWANFKDGQYLSHLLLNKNALAKMEL